jgi:hypothetical protein
VDRLEAPQRGEALQLISHLRCNHRDARRDILERPAVELGVIAGTGTVNPIGSILVPEEDDGIVSLESAKLEGMTNFLVAPN